MEQGSKTLLIILCAALLLGALVVGINPAYRRAFLSTARGRPAESPIWKSNSQYYPDIVLSAPAVSAPEARHDAE